MRKQQQKKKKGREIPTDIRIDKWLWAARFYKTRTLAKSMVEGGKVHYNGMRVKSSRIVEVGAMVKLWQGNEEKEIEILAITDQRKGAPEAQTLYQETEESVEKREKMSLARKANYLSMPHPDRRPNKKERRDLIKFKHSEK